MYFQDSCRYVGPTAVLALLLLQASCAADSGQTEAGAYPNGGRGGTTSATSTGASLGQSLTFNAAPLEPIPVFSRRDLTVTVNPARHQTVTFALIGNSLDASLDASQIVSDSLGFATVALTASSIPTAFTVRASLDPSTVSETNVRVTQAMTGSLEVTAKYAGLRHTQSYSIAAYPNKDCSSPNLGAGATDRVYAEVPSLPVRLDGIPLATPLALVVTGGVNLLRGCLDVRGLSDGSSLTVQVPLDDIPMDLRDSTLGLSLSTTDGLKALKEQFSTPIAPLVSALGTSGHDMIDLLAAMESTAPGSLQQEFSAQREASAWDTLVVNTYLPVNGADLLRRQLMAWLKSGVDYLATQPTFRIRLDLGPSDSSTPRLSLLSIAGVDNISNVLMKDCSLALNPEAGDRLNWSSEMSINSPNLLDQLALTAAQVEAPGLNTIPAQLENRLNCNSFAALLNDNVVWSNSSSRECSATCLSALCASGLNTMYRRATSAVYGFRTAILLNASGLVEVDSAAKPASIVGTWIGAFDAAAGAGTVAGALEGQ